LRRLPRFYRARPPPRYNEGALIEAMQNAWRFVDDEVLRDRLKEAKGIASDRSGTLPLRCASRVFETLRLLLRQACHTRGTRSLL
jgi:hypothetical protein